MCKRKDVAQMNSFGDGAGLISSSFPMYVCLQSVCKVCQGVSLRSEWGVQNHVYRIKLLLLIEDTRDNASNVQLQDKDKALV